MSNETKKCPMCGSKQHQERLHVATEYDSISGATGPRRPIAAIFNFRCRPCGELYALRVPQ